jgi:5-formyltetrahydrofolate cyclo-ligase
VIEDLTIERVALRQRLRATRRAISAPERIAAADTLAQRLLALPFAPVQGHVAGYWAMDGEIALHVWQIKLPPPLVYCLPVLCNDILRFAPWRPGAALVTNRFGIPEPDVPCERLIDAGDMALVVVPLVGFDARGHRLGMGGGWYDRSFGFRIEHAAPPWLIGVGFAVQQLDAIGTQPWDVSLDAICSERETLLAGSSHGPQINSSLSDGPALDGQPA